MGTGPFPPPLSNNSQTHTHTHNTLSLSLNTHTHTHKPPLAGSQALHSERMLIFEPLESKLRKVSIGSYSGMLVGLKRR